MACELGQEIADSPIETCFVARMWMICLLAAWSMTKRSEEGGCTQKDVARPNCGCVLFQR
jgi:hypothetical protein